MSYEADQQAYNDEDTREIEGMRKMFVGGLSRGTTEETFFNYFGQYGEMVDKVIITDNQTKESRGFGFITYAKSDSVEQVFKSRPHSIDDKTLDVKRAMPREYNTAGAHSKTNKLFIGGFKNLDFKPEELQEYIESRHSTEFGHIDSIDFLKDKEGNLKGFGFLECSSTDFADRLAISENSFTLKGRSMSIKKAEPKTEGPGASGGMGSRGGGRGSAMGGGRGGGMRGGRGGNSRGGGRGAGGRSSGFGNGGGQGYGGGNFSTSYPSFGNDYGQNQNYGGGYQQQNYGQQNQGYGNNYNSYGMGNQQGGYNNFGGNQGNYGGGRGAGRGSSGGQRYQPY